MLYKKSDDEAIIGGSILVTRNSDTVFNTEHSAGFLYLKGIFRLIKKNGFYQSIDITALKKCVCVYEIQSALQCSKCKKYWLMSTVRKVITK